MVTNILYLYKTLNLLEVEIRYYLKSSAKNIEVYQGMDVLFNFYSFNRRNQVITGYFLYLNNLFTSLNRRTSYLTDLYIF